MGTVHVIELIRRKQEADDCAKALQRVFKACGPETELYVRLNRAMFSERTTMTASDKSVSDIFSTTIQNLYRYSELLGSYIDSAEVEFPVGGVERN